jgi:hypothetical protein
MSNIGPSAPRTPEQDRLEYLKGMASAPMGWAGNMPSVQSLDPAEVQEMLSRKRPPTPVRPWYLRREFIVAVLLTAGLVTLIIWVI